MNGFNGMEALFPFTTAWARQDRSDFSPWTNAMSPRYWSWAAGKCDKWTPIGQLGARVSAGLYAPRRCWRETTVKLPLCNPGARTKTTT